jgi:excisionase family DNA binding protein
MNISELNEQPLTVSVSKALRMLGLGRTHFYQLISQGRIRILKCGRRTLIPVQSLHDFLNSLEADDAAA